MMMWGKWRIYDRTAFDQGLVRPPPRSVWRNKKALINAHGSSTEMHKQQMLERILVLDLYFSPLITQ